MHLKTIKSYSYSEKANSSLKKMTDCQPDLTLMKVNPAADTHQRLRLQKNCTNTCCSTYSGQRMDLTLRFSAGVCDEQE